MNFNKHSEIRDDEHAFLGASNYHWINYDEDQLVERYKNYQAAQQGTETHAYAAWSIKRGQKLPKNHKTLNTYVNDAIGYRLQPEQKLVYSENVFGKSDAIMFRNNFLRIHDLKTGVIPAHMEQLYIYAALFCLEYRIKPESIQMETRLYQNDDIIIANPTADDIIPIMSKAVAFNKLINNLKAEEA